MQRALALGLAGLAMIAPASRGQERILSPTFLAPTLTTIPLRAVGTDSASARISALPRAVQDEEDGKARLGRIVTWTLIGALAGGAIGYYTGPEPSCTGCEEQREPRMLKGALIGGSVGFTLGALVTLGGGRSRMTLRRGD